MAQGKIKVKTNNKPPPSKKNKPVKNKGGVTKNKGGGVKKGKFTFAAKKNTQNQIQKFKKSIQKGINANIESELKGVALKQEEGKAFKAIGSQGAGSSKS